MASPCLRERLGLGLPELLARTDRIVHGTTVATNALLERKGAKVAMLTTEGHRDVIEMREGLKPERYNLRLPAAPALVPRRLRLPVAERIRPDGTVEVPLDRTSLNSAIAVLKAEKVEAVAICFLHSWRDDAHERAAAEAVRTALPGCLRDDVRGSAPADQGVRAIFHGLRQCLCRADRVAVSRAARGRLADAGYKGSIFVILSHGGVAPVEEAARLATGTALSGPAGGVAAGVALAQRGVGQNLITFDVGGTSTDIALVLEGEAALGRGRTVGGERIALESLDIVTLGAGGGSIGHVGAGGTLQVGPRSAGAVPGPVAYGQGGTEPTVTDANLVLGYLDKDELPRWRAQARPRRRTGCFRQAGGFGRSSRHGRRGGRAPPGQCPHGRRHPHRHRPTRRGSARFHPAGLRRRGGAACDRRGAGTRDAARRRADLRRGAFGLGHAAHRPPLRDGTQRAHLAGCRTTLRCAPSGPGWKPKAAPASHPGSAARSRQGAPPICAMASRSSRLPCRSSGRVGTRPV